MEGVVELEYIKKGKNEKSILQKDKSWEKVLKENIWSPTMKYPMGEVYKFHKFKVSLQVVDHGVLDKCYNVNISKLESYGKYKWDSQIKEYIKGNISHE
ncbi:MAG: hypothetical protein A2474_05980 [Elusimicrobia bacterium RIFOXYC2_FULL_34_12]|nr:MAG: hypothetical protein A2474_05980 [Elusimicrobia bacterium RIFOXYC2_FULL_34_12]